MYSMDELLKDPKEKAEYERLVKLLKQMNEGSAVTPIEAQQATSCLLNTRNSACYLCGVPNNVYEAAKTITPGPGEEYRCKCCNVRLEKFVPFMGLEPWRWSRPRDLSPVEARDAVTQWDART